MGVKVHFPPVGGALDQSHLERLYSLPLLLTELMKALKEAAELDSFPFYCHLPPGSTLWYDHSHPSNPRLHQAHVSPVLEAGPMPRPLSPLIHSLRALKSSSEVALMQEAGRITAQVGVSVNVR